MSVKDVHQQKSKKPSDVRSLRQRENSTQSSSSSSHIVQLQQRKGRLHMVYTVAIQTVRQLQESKKFLIGKNDQFSKELFSMMQANIEMWQQTAHQKWVKQQEIKENLKEFWGSPSKPRKRTNYALQKVKYPPSDNE